MLSEESAGRGRQTQVSEVGRLLFTPCLPHSPNTELFFIPVLALSAASHPPLSPHCSLHRQWDTSRVVTLSSTTYTFMLPPSFLFPLRWATFLK